ncbi:hypothetical protein A3B18_02275 [Candidatus Giovannonibacteria bacterium RIFCSPLOWO2_01_FULL_46_13]|uniref:Uncharacterized protein n=1 Tax=Candidatus Giovannonibacteria bacterium RIFCSPLOWO2_01_FULL_46_13 TaxID=1798352 RepID=A0A1F5X4Z1_9BACT|nr:MAG: hypothetical protein A3B18_02275 [Candidatus Giovannonibacteria bacterium RIFCSPLOWO2_01_FULL_46_13]
MNKTLIVSVVVVIVLAALYFFWAPIKDLTGLSNLGEQNTPETPQTPSATPPAGTPQASTKKIRVISPNGGEVWQRGKQYNVRWDTTLATNIDTYVDLIPATTIITNPYSATSRITGTEMFHSSIFPQDNTPGEGSFSYRVPDAIKPGTYQVLVLMGKDCNALTGPRCDFDLSDKLLTIK